jgi:hypothetical protein
VPVAFLHSGNNLALHADHAGGREATARTIVCHFAEFACPNAAIKLLPDAGVRRLSRAARQGGFENRTPLDNRRSLENVISRPGHRPLCADFWFSRLVLPVCPSLSDNSICLVAELRGQLPMPPQHFFL